jgi:hypothetical protein
VRSLGLVVAIGTIPALVLGCSSDDGGTAETSDASAGVRPLSDSGAGAGSGDATTSSSDGASSGADAGGTAEDAGGTFDAGGSDGSADAGAPSGPSATLTPATQHYLPDTDAPAPTVTYASSTAGVVCTIADSGGYTHTTSGSVFTFLPPTPAVAGTFLFPATCAAGATAIPAVPAAATLIVDSPCDASQLADLTVGGAALTRQCLGGVDYSGDRFGLKHYNGPVYSLAAVLHGSWANYATGYSVTPEIATGSYIALAFVATSPGSVEMTNDPSFGDGGWISLSTLPGHFKSGDPAVLASLDRGAGNSLQFSSDHSIGVAIEEGTTYYVNMADVDAMGNALCFGGAATCTYSYVSYNTVIGK